MRTDIDDRNPEQVLEKSLNLGKEMTPAQIVGAVWIDNEELATGIAIDPFTVLTAAHHKGLKEAKVVRFKLHSNAQGGGDKEHLFRNVQKVVMHPEFETLSYNPVALIMKSGSLYLDDVLVKDLEAMSFDQYYASFGKKVSFSGVDLAILKLDKPLSDSLTYPSFTDASLTISEQYSLSIGFGIAKFNNQEQIPAIVSSNLYNTNKRHVISCKVSSTHMKGNVQVLYGNYKGLLANGDESFIPNKAMMKMEGLPVRGDSGGPLFIKIGDEYQLTGIMSNIYAPLTQGIDQKDIRVLLQDVKQPIFPTWIDIRPYLPWVKSLMGTGKVTDIQEKCSASSS